MAAALDLNGLQEVLNLPFPANTRQAAGTINGVLTDVQVISFSDRILVTISQHGRLAHWLHVPLENQNPGTDGSHTFTNGYEDDSLLPLSNLTATSLLGGHAHGHEITNQLLARQIGSAIATKTPNEKRVLVVGLGLDRSHADRDTFFALVELVLQCI
ncbi:proteasome assembly chaperone 3 [Talaromyces islandicus]|uniref:Proteasome assembly chaperone 3 n=1 Tax=Talaromyces islandicus TaxID=28573 RepID=A0A0U1LS61_TALIS|nr:proteasome assembly chaperone 3 [Talaromyces islandicus]